MEQILWDLNFSKDEIEDVTRIDGSRDKGIDAWYLDNSGQISKLILIQSKDDLLERADFAKMREGLRDLFDPRRPQSINRALREKAADLGTNTPSELEVEFHVVSSRVAPSGLEARGDGLPNWEDSISLFGLECVARNWTRDVRFLVENLQLIHREPIQATFIINPNEYFEYHAGGHTKSVNAAIAAPELASLYQHERTNLFRHNPRYYLGARRVVNQKIVETLTSDDRDNFFLLNNGLTAMCTAVRAEQDISGAFKLVADDFQIVNGCQTTASIHSVWADSEGVTLLRNVRVPIKIIEQPPASSLGATIAGSTNTQTAVVPEDWRANDRRQEALHEDFARLPAGPWFYEHKRSVWNSEYASAADRRPFRDDELGYRHVGMKDLAQSCWAFLGHPADAKDRAASIFSHDQTYETVFPLDSSAVQLLLPHLIYVYADRWTRSHREREEKPVSMTRYPMVYCIARALQTLAGGTELGYFSREQSEHLARNNKQWLEVLFNLSFDVVLSALVREAAATGRGARSIVRTGSWLQDPSDEVLRLVKAKVEMEVSMISEYGRPGSGFISSLLPFQFSN